MSEQPKQQYGGVARVFHWAVAAAIVLQFVLAKLYEFAADGGERIRQIALIANHKSVGMTILMVAVLRLVWRFRQGVPKLPSSMPGWQIKASHLSHWLLYGSLFLLPVTGWLMSSASAYSVSWFGVFTWPDLIAPDTSLKETLKMLHDLFAKILFVVAILHIAAALKHHWVDRDQVLTRMTGTASLALFVAVIGVGLFALTPASAPQASTEVAEEKVAAAVTAAQPVSVDPNINPLKAWVIDYAASEITFTAEQAGAEFTGRWGEWKALMRFDPAALDDSQFSVDIGVHAVDTQDEERDSTLQDSDWFDEANYPTVRFETNAINVSDTGFEADSVLVIKGERHPVVFQFDVAEQDGRKILTGQARLDRLALNVGTGDWTDTEWVGQFVDVAVTVTASLP
ncbi:MAG: cytochrome b/b6 domain-containing protein [Pseudomonadota bacterium]